MSTTTTTTSPPGAAGKSLDIKHLAVKHRGILIAAFIAALLGVLWASFRTRPAPPATAPSATPAPGGAPSPSVVIEGAARAKNPIATTAVERARLIADLDLVGSATYDGDHYAVVGPLVHGRVVAIRARPGDDVQAGQVLAEIESAEVGQAQASYIAAAARSRMSEANEKREARLAEQRISSGREREIAEAQARTDAAELRAAEQRLLALGLDAGEIAALDAGRRRAGRVALRAPIAGTVTKRSITLGQAVEAATDAFHVADLRRLWVNLDVFEKDLAQVHVGQQAVIRTESHPDETFPSRVAWIEPRIDDATRTASVRVEFENRARKLRPGQFVTAHLHGEPRRDAPEVIAVPRKAIVTVEGRPFVFVEEGEGRYGRRPVEVGRSGGDLVEVRAGVEVGERVVTDGAFLLKSESLR